MLTPRLPERACLLVSDGNLGSLVLAALLAESRDKDSDQPSLIYPAWWTHDDDAEAVFPAVDRALERYAELYGFDLVTDRAGYPDLTSPGTTDPALWAGFHQTRLLLDACELAATRGIRTVVWAAQTESSSDRRTDEITTVIDRALLVARLATLDAQRSGDVEVNIETPIVDLDDSQILDLASDLSVPLDAGWWRDSPHEIALRQRTRWAAATAGVPGAP